MLRENNTGFLTKSRWQTVVQIFSPPYRLNNNNNKTPRKQLWRNLELIQPYEKLNIRLEEEKSGIADGSSLESLINEIDAHSSRKNASLEASNMKMAAQRPTQTPLLPITVLILFGSKVRGLFSPSLKIKEEGPVTRRVRFRSLTLHWRVSAW